VPGDAAAGDLSGRTLALDGSVVLIGAHFDDDASSGSGAAYVFRRDGTQRAQEQKLVAGDVAAGDSFGWTVSVQGNVALVGAFHDAVGFLSQAGSAYAFRYDGSSWHEKQKLVAPDAAPGDLFGQSVSVQRADAGLGRGRLLPRRRGGRGVLGLGLPLPDRLPLVEAGVPAPLISARRSRGRRRSLDAGSAAPVCSRRRGPAAP